MAGLGGNNNFTLNPGDPVLTGTTGDDTFAALPGNSGVNGLSGNDTITFNFRLVDATVSYVGNVVIVDSATSHTELTGFQTYQFTDGTVNENDGNALVADLFYYSQYHDIWNAHVDADLHYNLYGWHEHRNPNAFFNTDFYLALYPDVAASGINPLTHYDQSGWKEGRSPSPAFDTQQYLLHNPDVAAAHVDPLLHFLTSGVEEGRQPFALAGIFAPNGFDYVYYLQHNPDVAAAHVDAFQHFQTNGWHEGRNPNAYFDTRGYLATYTDVANAGVNPLDHYDSNGWKEGRDPSPGFDSNQYLLHYTDVAAAHIDPLTHFLRYGINEGRTAFAKPVGDTEAAANTVLEGAAAGTHSGITATWGGWISPALSFSLSGDTSGGGFAIDAVTGLITVVDASKLDYETSGPSHSYVVTVAAHDGDLTNTQDFAIAVGDVSPTAPVDVNAAANSTAEGAANGSAVGITLFSNEPNGPPVTYSLSDNAGGRFAINASTGVVTVADGTLLDFETSGPSHSFTITAQATSGAITTATQSFAINVTDAPPSVPADTNGAANSVTEGSPTGTAAGITVSATDPNGPAASYSLTDSAGGRFAINPTTGVVTIANASLVDFESAPGHAYSITAQATVGALSSSQTFAIGVADVAPAQPTDGNGGANTVLEGATTGAVVGVTVASTDVNGGALTYSFADIGGGVLGDAGGRFQINSATGVVAVSAAGAATIDYETAGGGTHNYSITVQASDGTLVSSTQSFTIGVTNANPSTPTDSNGTAGGTIQEGTGSGVAVGITAASTDPGGTAIVYSLVDTLGGRFAINASSGVVSTGANANLIDFEGSGGNYSITVQASDGAGGTSTQAFAIAVTNANPSNWTDGNGATNTVTEGVGSGAGTGVTVQATDPGGTTLSYTLTDDASGRFQIANSATGVVTTGPNASLINFETSGGSYQITAQASDGAGGTSTQIFTIAVADAPPANWSDVNAAADTVVEDAANDTTVGIHANAIDPNGGTVSYTFAVAADSANGAFKINATTGEVSVADHTKVNFEVNGTHTYNILVTATTAGGTATSTQGFVVNVTDVAPSQPIDNVAPTGGTVAEGASGGTSVLITAQSTDVNGGTVIYSLSNDAGGLFDINSGSGAVTVQAGAVIDYETTAPGHTYSITVDASDGTLSSSQSFSIAVTNVAPSAPTDANGTANTVSNIAADGTTVGVTLSSTDINGGALTYELVNDQGGRFTVNSTTGVVTVKAGHPVLAPGVTYNITARASDGTDFGATSGNIPIVVTSNQLQIDLDGPTGDFNFATTYTEQQVAPTRIPVVDSDVSITNPGANPGSPGTGNATSATVILTNAQLTDSLFINGALPGGITSTTTTGAGTITVVLTGLATYDQYETALHQIEFSTAGDPTANAPNTTARTIDISVIDATGTSNVPTTTVTVTPVNDAPDLTPNSPSGPLAYTENGAAIPLLAAPTPGLVTDPDRVQNYLGGSFKVEITGNAAAGDQIVVLGSSPFAVDSGGTVKLLSGGHTIATVSAGGLATSSVTLSLTAFATPTIVNQLVHAFGYQSSSDAPSGSQRTVTFTFNDGANIGAGALSDSVTQTINVTAVDDAPVASNGATSGSEGPSISGTAAAADPDSALVFSVVGQGAFGNVIFTNPATGAFTYTPTDPNFNGTDTFTFKATGSAVDSNTATFTINLSAVNDAPVLDGTGSTSPAYTENGAATQLLSNGTVTDADLPANFAVGGFTVEITSLTSQAGDEIVLRSGTGFTLADNGGTFSILSGGHLIGTLAFNTLPSGVSAAVTGLTSFATPTVVQDLIRAFGYRSSVDNLDTTARNVNFIFNDGGNTGSGGAQPSNTVAQTITLTAVNDAPVNHVTTAAQVTSTNTDITFNQLDPNGITISDVDVAGNDMTVTLTVTHGTLTLGSTPGTLTSFTNNAASISLTGSFGDINTALDGLVYHPTAGYNGTDALTITTSDLGNTGTPGAQQDIDTIPIEVIADADLTGQLWYVTRNGAATDNKVGHLNSNGTAISPTQDTGVVNENDITLDTSAGLYFIVNNLTLEARHTSDGSLAGSVDLAAAGFTAADAVTIDPIYATLFVGVTGAGAGTTGILEVGYDPSTGVLTNAGHFLLNQTSVAGFVHATDLIADAGSRVLYYVNSDAAGTANAISAVAYGNGNIGPTFVGAITPDQPTPAPTTLTTAAQFPALTTDPLYKGEIVAVAIDDRNDSNAGNDVVYFLTAQNGGLGLNALWYVDRSVGTTATAVTGVTLTSETTHTGLSYDPVGHALFISDEGTSILQAHLSAIGTVDTITHTYTTSQLIGHAPAGSPIPAGTVFDTLPIVDTHDTNFSEGTPVLVDPLFTISDPDLELVSATITVTGGFVGSGDVLTINSIVAGINDTLTTDPNTGNITLTLTGRQTIAQYMGAIVNTLEFDSGDNPDNFGNNTTRTITWHFNDGAAGDPHTTGNTQTTTINITASDDTPTVDLDVSNNNDPGATTGYTTTYTENGAAVPIADVDLAIVDPDDETLNSVTLTVTDKLTGDILSINGPLPTGITASSYSPGTGILTLTGNGTNSLADFQAALRQVVFSNQTDNPGAADRHVNVVVNSGSGAGVDSNTATALIHVTVSNDAPVVTATTLAAQNEDIGNAAPGASVTSLFSGHFTDGEDGTTVTGIAVSANTANAGTEGAWQYSTDAGTNWFDVGSVADATALKLSAATLLRFVPVADYNGTPPALTVYGLDSTAAGTFTSGVTRQNIDATVNGGATAISDNSTTIGTSITAVNDAPVLALNGGGGNDYSTSYTISTAGAAIAPSALTITDADDTRLASAVITLTDRRADDTLAITGALPGGITGAITSPSGTIVVTLTAPGGATLADFKAALQQVVFANGEFTSNTAADRHITVVLNDGHGANNTSTARTTTIDVVQDTQPTGTNDGAVVTAGGANPTGNVLANDTDPAAEGGNAALVVSAVRTDQETPVGTPVAGVVGNALVGSYGALTLNFDGTYTYQLDNNNAAVKALGASGHLHDFFTYTVRDTAGRSDLAQLDVDITGINDPPTAVADPVSATERGGLANGTAGVDPGGNVTTNDTDPDSGDSKTVVGVALGNVAGPLSGNVGTGLHGAGAADLGTLTIGATGTYTYVVNNSNAVVQALRTFGQTLTDTFSYTMQDSAAQKSTTQVTVTIHGQNDNPVANNDTASATEAGGAVAGTNISNFNVLTGVGTGSVADTDVDSAANGETQAVQGVAAGNQGATVLSTGVASGIVGTYGTLTLNATGTYNYVVNNAALNVQQLNTTDHPHDVFTYTMRDTSGATANATIDITVNGTNDAPVAVADGTYVVFENRANAVTTPTLLANDSDVDTASGLTSIKDTDTVHGGAVVVNTNGTFSVNYAPGSNYLGTDTFTYHTNDNGSPNLSSSSATVTLDVQPLVWYIDSSIGVSDATHFKTIAEFNTANAGATHADIVYLMYGNPVGTGVYSTADGINLSSGQLLLGSGLDLTYTKSDATVVTLLDVDNTKVATIQVTGGAGNAGVTLSTNNTLKGFHIDSTNADAIGIEDGAGTVGTLTISNGVDITGVGKAIDIDQGGTLAVTLANVTSTGSNSEGIQLSGVGGSFAVTGTTSITNADTTAIQVGTTAASASFNFGTSTTVTDTVIGGGSHNGNGIDLSTAIGATNSFTFGNLSVTTDGGYGLKAASAGTVNFGATNSLNATGGAAADITSTTLSGATFATVSSSGSADYGINLVNQTSGTFTASGGTIGTANLAGVHISGGTAAASIASAINSSNGNAVDISGHSSGQIDLTGTINHTSGGDKGIIVNGNTGGAINFTGQTTIASTTANGVDLTSNGGTTINFNAASNGLDITTTSGTGFNATGGAAAINVQGSGNTISSTTGTALNIVSTTIGANDITFQSISAGTAAGSAGDGIILDTTGTLGGLKVTGNGTNIGATGGGVIQHKTGADASTTAGNGIYLNNTSEVSLNGMDLHDFDNHGIFGLSVGGFKLTNSTIGGTIGTTSGANDLNLEAPIEFGKTSPSIANGFLTGSSSLIDNVNISGGIQHNVEIYQDTGTFNLTISNSNIHDNSVALGSDGVNIETTGTAHGIIKVNNTTFDDNKSQALQANALGSSFLELTLANDTILTSTQGNEGFILQNAANGDLTVAITNNTFTGINGTNILVGNVVNNATSAAELNATVSGNTMTLDAPAFNRTLIAFFSSSAGQQSTSKVLIDGNTINTISDPVNGMAESLFVSTPDANTSPLVYVTVSNNVVNIDDNNHLALRGIAVQSTQTTSTMHADVRGNDVNYLDGAPAGVNGIRVRQVNPATLDLEPGVGGANAAAVLAANNPLSTTEVVGTVTVSANNSTALLPSNPATPSLPSFLMAAGGQGPDSSAPLTADALTPIVAEAIHRWADAGATADQLAMLAGTHITIADLDSGVLAGTSGSDITIDVNGAGWGWFADPTPGDNSEFAAVHSPTELAATTGDAAEHIDLLTTVMHELGHAFGLEHSHAPGDLMDATVDLGIRRLPDAEDVRGPVAVSPKPLQLPDAPVHQEIIGHNIVGGFDAEYYLAHNPDVAAAGVDALAHFNAYGWHEGRNPNAFFDTAGYLTHYADVAAAGLNPLVHYEIYGWSENRDPSAGFDTVKYLAANPDVAAAHVNPLDHFLQYGFHEGRSAINDGLWFS